jgi:adenylate cyclase class IV
VSQIDELEVKTRVDAPDVLTRRLVAAGARLVFRGAMIDRRFDRGGAFEKVDEVVRLRVYEPADGGATWGVLGWKGPVGRRGEYRHRAEAETRVEDPAAVVTLLEHLGLAMTLRIDRVIDQYELGGAVLRLERYPGMDTLLEVEGSPDAIERAVAATGLPRADFVPESLPYFVAAYERRTGRRAQLAASDAA